MRNRLIAPAAIILPVLLLALAACGPKPHEGKAGAPTSATPKGAPLAEGPTVVSPEALPPGADPNAPSSGPPPPIATPVAPPPPAPKETFAGDLNLAGTEPFWSTEIRAGRITLKRPGSSDVAIPNPGPIITGDSAIWDGSGDGAHLTVVLEKAACNNGMGPTKYAYKASVKVGETVLKGCAAHPGAKGK